MSRAKPACTGPAHDLFLAAQNNQVEGIRLALASGANVDEGCGCKGGARPLFAAVGACHIEATAALIQAGADPNFIGAFPHQAPLAVAAAAGFVPLARVLLQGGADPNFAGLHGFGALHTASTPQMARLLLDAGAFVDANAHSGTPLQSVALMGYLDVVRVLVEAGADINASLNEWATPYALAVAQDHDEVAAYLLAVEQERELQHETALPAKASQAQRL